MLTFADTAASLFRLLERDEASRRGAWAAHQPKQDYVATRVRAVRDRVLRDILPWRCRPWLDPGRGATVELGENAPPPLPNDAPVTDVSATAMVTANIGTRFGFMVAPLSFPTRE